MSAKRLAMLISTRACMYRIRPLVISFLIDWYRCEVSLYIASCDLAGQTLLPATKVLVCKMQPNGNADLDPPNCAKTYGSFPTH